MTAFTFDGIPPLRILAGLAMFFDAQNRNSRISHYFEPVMDGMKKQPRFGMVWEKEPRQHGHRKSGFNFLDSYRTFEKSCQWNELNQKLCRLLASIRNNCLEITFTGELSRSLSRSIFLIACDSLFNLKYLMLNAFCFIRHISTVVSTGVFLAYINFPW